MNENPTLTLSLELNQINIILSALQELPGKLCNPLTDNIKAQAVPQLQALNTPRTTEMVVEVAPE